MTSTYKINFNDGTSNAGANPIVIERQTKDDTTDVTLFGRGTFDYGNELNENLVHLLEHFASQEDTRAAGTTPSEKRDIVANTGPAISNWPIHAPAVGQLWANKTTHHIYALAHNIRKWDPLVLHGDVTSNWGTISDGMTIPLPVSASGHVYTADECVWIVSPRTYGNDVGYMEMSADDRLVVALTGVDAGSAAASVANYMIVGIRENVNAGLTVGDDASSGQALTVFAGSTAVVGNIDETIGGTITVEAVDGSGTPIDPSLLTYVWYRVAESGDAICSAVTYDEPARLTPTSSVFTFSAISPFAGSCSPTWRVVVTDNSTNPVRRGEATVQLVFVFQSPQNVLQVAATSIAYASAQANDVAEAAVSAIITGGTGPYIVQWSDEAIDGSGAIKVTQTPPVTPPAVGDGVTLSTTAEYSLQRATAQTVFTRVSISVTDADSNQARAFTTIRYNFIEADEGIDVPTQTPLMLIIDGTTEGVYTIENSAYIASSPGADSNVYTLTVPVQVDGTTAGNQISAVRLRDADQIQFSLISPAVISNNTAGQFIFSISAASATNYPGTNSDAWRITFVAQDGRTISRDIITKFNYLTTQQPLAANVGNVTVNAVATDAATPDRTYVTLTAVTTGGVGPYSYTWNTSDIDSLNPFEIVGPVDRSTITLALRGATFNRAQSGATVWPAPSLGATTHTYSVSLPCTVRDSSLPAQTVIATGTAAIKFTVDDSGMATAATYSYITADLTYNPADPYTMKGCWICNGQFVNAGSAPWSYETFSRVTLYTTGGSGAYQYVWIEDTVAVGSTLTGQIVFPSGAPYNQGVYFRPTQTNCVAGNRFYEATWRCEITDLHTGKVISHDDVVRLDVCKAGTGVIDTQIQRVPCGAGFTCA